MGRYAFVASRTSIGCSAAVGSSISTRSSDIRSSRASSATRSRTSSRSTTSRAMSTLDEAGDQRRIVEIALETTRSRLRDVGCPSRGRGLQQRRLPVDRGACSGWLESLRTQQIAGRRRRFRGPPLEPDAAAGERRGTAADVSTRSGDGCSRACRRSRRERTADQQAHYLLAYLLDWHYREDKVAWWEYFRLLELSDEELIDEPAAVAGLEFVERVGPVHRKKTGKPTGSMIDRYRYPPQECEIRAGDELKTRDEKKFGDVVVADRVTRTLDVKKGKSVVDLHPCGRVHARAVSPGRSRLPHSSGLENEWLPEASTTHHAPRPISCFVARRRWPKAAAACRVIRRRPCRRYRHGRSREARWRFRGRPGPGRRTRARE